MRSWLAFMFVLALAAVARAEPMCPMITAPGTTVTVVAEKNDVALVYHTSSGQVAQLREQVRAMADAHNQHQAQMQGMQPGCCQGGRMGAGGKPMMVAAAARVEDVRDGARLVFTPQDANKLGALHQQLENRAARMQPGQCPMMGPP